MEKEDGINERLIDEVSNIVDALNEPPWNEIDLENGKRGSVMIGVSQALFQIAEELHDIKQMMRADRTEW